MIEKSPTIGALAAALVKVQSSLQPARKTSVNPFHKSQYADLAEVWNACRATLTENGIAVTQFPSSDSMTGEVSVETMLIHTSGEFLSKAVSAHPKDLLPQSVGSAITYLRRYGLASAIGVITEDDDGEGAQPRGPHAAPRPAENGKPKAVPEAAKPKAAETAQTGTDVDVIRRIVTEIGFATNKSTGYEFQKGLLGCEIVRATPAQQAAARDAMQAAALNADIVRWNSETWQCSSEMKAYSIGLIIAHARLDGFQKTKAICGEPSKFHRLDQIQKMNANLLSWLDRPQLQQAA